MDEDYFATFSHDDVAMHIRMSSRLDSSHRIELQISPRPNNEFEIVIVGFDYLSEFSVFCGLLSSFGLDIHSGDIYSFGRHVSRSSPRKIVDVFRAGLKGGETFDDAKQREFESELQTLANLLAAGSADQARERLNRFLTERIERMKAPLSGLLSPVEISFDNQAAADWTLMEMHSEDTFAFLYAISNALAMQGIYIHKVRIRSSGNRVRDQFFISNRWGRKIEDSREQQKLKTAVAMIKRFTSFLPEAPDPAKAMRHFDQLLDKLAEQQFPDHFVSFLGSTEGMNLLAHLLGSSDFLWDDFLRVHFRDLAPLLEDLGRTPGKETLRRELQSQLANEPEIEGRKRELNRFKDSKLFLIDARHLVKPDVMEFSRALTDLAEVVIDEATNVCYEHLGRQEGRFTVCGLGKFGGREMGYASDLELLFVHEGASPFFETLAHHVVEFIEARSRGIFHIDLRLRPYGDAGAWSTPFEQFVKYYSPAGEAAPFERQALIKLRWVAGDEVLGRRVEAHRDSFTYSQTPVDWENARRLRQRQMRELVKPGEINVKYSSGGIIDVEYAVQYLQLQHGRQHAELRVPNTLEALDTMHRLGIMTDDQYAEMQEAYLFLRKLIDAMRMVRGDASDLVLPDKRSEEFKSLVRRLGYGNDINRRLSRFSGF